MDHPGRTLAIALAAVSLAVGSLPFLGTEFMPKLDEGSILIETRKLPSVSLQESVDMSKRVEQIVASFPEVRQVVTKIGRPDLATEAMGIYQGDAYVALHPVESWTTGRDKAALIDAIAGALKGMPGMTFNFTQPMAMRLDEVISGVKADVAVKIFGQDPATLERLGEVVVHELEQVQGASDLQAEVLFGAAQLQIEIDRAQIARYGLMWVTFIGGTIVVRKRSHIAVEVLLHCLPKDWARGLLAVIDVVKLGFMGLLALFAVQIVSAMHWQRMVIIDLPMSVVYGGIALGCFMMLLREIQNVWRNGRDGWRKAAASIGEGLAID